MNKKNLVTGLLFTFLVLIITCIFLFDGGKTKEKSNELSGIVMKYDDDTVTIQDDNLCIYTFKIKEIGFDVGDILTMKYTGVLDKNNDGQDCEVIDYTVSDGATYKNGIPSIWADNGIFKDYYKLAYNKLSKMTLDEKIGQLLLARYPDSNQIADLKKYKLSGFVFYEKDFKDKTETQVKSMINNLQNNSDIPLLTAVDEEGGKVVRVSSNTNLVKEKFKSPSELYDEGGFDAIAKDTIDKSRILYNLGLNLNLAPVVDVSTDSSDYIYDRTLKQDTDLTSTYAKTVIESSKGTGVSYTLKHFPGYSSNSDTHESLPTDNRSLEEIKTVDLPPFESGIKAGAEAVLLSHNVVDSIDGANPASLSPSVHNLLRNELGFTGITITDDIAMKALDGIDKTAVKAILAGNDLIITTNYADSFTEIKGAVDNGTISEAQIDKLAFRVLAWKYYKLLMIENDK